MTRLVHSLSDRMVRSDLTGGAVFRSRLEGPVDVVADLVSVDRGPAMGEDQGHILREVEGLIRSQERALGYRLPAPEAIEWRPPASASLHLEAVFRLT